MKKALAVLALLACIALPSFAAVTDTMFNIGLQNSSSVMTIDPESKGDVFKFELGLQADFNMIFDDGPGFDVALTAEQNFSSLELTAKVVDEYTTRAFRSRRRTTDAKSPVSPAQSSEDKETE